VRHRSGSMLAESQEKGGAEGETHDLLVHIPVSREFLTLCAAKLALGGFNGLVEVVLVSGAVVVVHSSGCVGCCALLYLIVYCGGVGGVLL